MTKVLFLLKSISLSNQESKRKIYLSDKSTTMLTQKTKLKIRNKPLVQEVTMAMFILSTEKEGENKSLFCLKSAVVCLSLFLLGSSVFAVT